MDATIHQFAGCLLGLAMGDALGAPHEGGPLERLVWRFIGRTPSGELRWTDDTQMTLDLGESLLEAGGVSPDALARRFAQSYRWSRGYGLGTARVLRRIRRGEPWQSASKAVYPGGSYGNGAAMRAPVLALFFANDFDRLLDAARQSAQVTHCHPHGVEGAVLIAAATRALLNGVPSATALKSIQAQCKAPEVHKKLQIVSEWIGTDATPVPREVAAQLGNGVAAVASCPTALYIALRHLDSPFDEMMRFIIACRGDVDTIGAMAGALWGVVNGPGGLPAVEIESRNRLEDLAARLWARQR